MSRWAPRLPLGALGLGLVLLVAGAWGTGFFYLLARLGAGSPVRLAIVDGVHVYVGLASAALFLAKIWRVGFRRRVPRVRNLQVWQRWISWSLLVLYVSIYATGIAALLPVSLRFRSYAVNAHLLSSVWAVVPTTWHAWHYRRRVLPYVTRWKPGRPARRYWQALGVICLPLVFVLAAPRSLSALPQAGGGGALNAAGLQGIYLDRLLPTSDGRLLAGGDGLYITAGDGAWRWVALPSGASPDTERQIELGIKPAAGAAPAVAGGDHLNHLAPATAGTVLSLAHSATRSAYYVGTSDGLYYSPWPEGPYLALVAPGPQVRDLAIDPQNPYVIWAAAEGGPFLSVDGGRSWAALTTGLQRPAAAWALAFFSGSLYTSDTSGIYLWDGSLSRWSLSSSQPWVTSLRAGGGRLFAASAVSGASSLDGRAWSRLEVEGDSNHQHGGAGHVLSVVPAFGHVYAVGSEGHLAGARDAAPLRSELWTAGELGAGRMTVDSAPAAGVGWWLTLLLITLVVAFLGLRMIRPMPRSVVADSAQLDSTIQEELNDSSQSGGRDSRGRVRGAGLRNQLNQLD